MAPLTKEQIDELLAGTLKPNRYGGYTPPKFEVPKQIGPLRFKTDRGTKPCQHTRPVGLDEVKPAKGYWCGSPGTVEVQGKSMCTLHALIVLNQMLIDLEVVE